MNFKQGVLIALLGCCLSSCSSSLTYRAYLGEPKPALRVALIRGSQYARQDSINRYIDAVKFASIDETEIDDSRSFKALEVEPGFHDIGVYFYWDMGSQRGLGPALVSYAMSKENLSRKLRFNARAGMEYVVKAQPYFDKSLKEDITTLSHVDFWIEDMNGIEIVSKAAGRYTPTQALPDNPT
jgi:hypothetical protein